MGRGRGRGTGSRLAGGVAARGAVASRPLPRSPLSVPVVQRWARELRSGDADELVHDLLALSGDGRSTRSQVRAAALAFASSAPTLRAGRVHVALDDEHSAELDFALAHEGDHVRANLDAVLLRGPHRLGAFEVEHVRQTSTDDDELLATSAALAELGRQLEAR